MTVVGISDDPVEDSARMAGELGIDYDLLADQQGQVAQQYVGRDDQGNALPGVVLIDRDGTVAYRMISATKDDRLDAAALLAVIDRTLGPVAGSVSAHGAGYQPAHRLQLRVEAGAGAVRADGWQATGGLGVAALVPLGAYLLTGPALRAEARGAIDASMGAALRVPVLAQIGWLTFAVDGGYTVADGRGPSVRGALGVQVAPGPATALHVELSTTWRDADDHSPSVMLTVGFSRLVPMK